jgi:lactoylglutathione lyase
MFIETFPILRMRDVPISLRFYQGLLGGTVTYQYPPEGDPEYVAVAIGSTRLGLNRYEPTLPGVNDHVVLWVNTVDCDAALATLRAGGVEPVEGPVNQPWGERVAMVTDPDGHRLYIASALR